MPVTVYCFECPVCSKRIYSTSYRQIVYNSYLHVRKHNLDVNVELLIKSKEL